MNKANIHTMELNSLVEMAKDQYAIFRTAQLSLRFGYLRKVEAYKDIDQYTKKTDRKALRHALVTMFLGLGDSKDEAERTTELYLQ